MQRTLVVRRSADASGQAMASVPERAAAPTPDAQKARETEVEVSLPRGRLGVTFEDMQEGGVMVVEPPTVACHVGHGSNSGRSRTGARP